MSDGGSIYNLACCYGILGEAELAALYIERAYNAGFEDIGHMSWDPDFENVRGEDVFDDKLKTLFESAEEAEARLGDVLYFDSPVYFECRVYLPDNYDPNKTYTLVVGLHGFGSNHDRFITLWEKFADRELIYASPQAPYPFLVGNGIGYSWANWIPGHRWMSERATLMTENYIAHVVKNLQHKYKVSDTYLMGFSQGCAFTYQAGIKNHELFKGLICFGGWLDVDWIGEAAIEAAKDLRIFIVHGTEDRMVEFAAGEESRDHLEGLGYDVTFYEFDGAHTVPEEALQAAEAWMNE
jgi:predicted esterase